MGKRILSTVVMWGLLFATMWYFRTTGAVILVALLCVLTLREFYQLLGGAGLAPFQKLGMAFGALITLSPWLHAQVGLPASSHALALAVIVFSIRILSERDPTTRVEALASTVFGLVYVALMLQYLVRILTPLPGDTVSPDGRLVLCLWLVATAKFCDVGALLTGLAIGRHHMAPQISPKKTWEGAVGGVLVSVGVGALVAWLGRGVLPPHFTPAVGAFLAAPVALVAIVSDLIESIIKRRAAIKDSGAGVPGIGGFFDVCDSLLLTAPLGYFLMALP
ncbi:MAG: phosphatidate cytidylyltransferase [Verrucomicrobia bacterium]|nr:phosphatidate cytidylyltransferase [Verrucomicrobiota bacterium]